MSDHATIHCSAHGFQVDPCPLCTEEMPTARAVAHVRPERAVGSPAVVAYVFIAIVGVVGGVGATLLLQAVARLLTPKALHDLSIVAGVCIVLFLLAITGAWRSARQFVSLLDRIEAMGRKVTP